MTAACCDLLRLNRAEPEPLSLLPFRGPAVYSGESPPLYPSRFRASQSGLPAHEKLVDTNRGQDSWSDFAHASCLRPFHLL